MVTMVGRKGGGEELAGKKGGEEARKEARKAAHELEMRKVAAEEEDRKIARELQLRKAIAEEEALKRRLELEAERLKFEREEAARKAAAEAEAARQKQEQEKLEAEKRAEQLKADLRARRRTELWAQFMQASLAEAQVYLPELAKILVEDGEYKRVSNAKVALLRQWNRKQQSTPIPATVLPNTGVYVLAAQDGYFDHTPITMHTVLEYVGKSNNIDMRLQQHAAGNDGGAVIVRQNPYLNKRVPTLTKGEEFGNAWEYAETLHRMRRFGISHVRGSSFATPTIDFRAAFRAICDHFDLCYQCGKEDHSTAECAQPAFNRWGDPF